LSLMRSVMRLSSAILPSATVTPSTPRARSRCRRALPGCR
jgi:hypothetical protein